MSPGQHDTFWKQCCALVPQGCSVVQGLKPAPWPEALKAVKKGLEQAKGNEIKAIAGKLADAESIMALKVNISRYKMLLL